MSGSSSLPTSAFDYELPNQQIARYPTERRDESRLLVLQPDGSIEHHTFRDITDMIPAGDVLVLNETRVMPARILGRRPGGGEAEVLLLAPHVATSESVVLWEALVRPGSKMRPGRRITVAPDFGIEVMEVLANGNRVVRLHSEGPPAEAIARYGRMPLPPYIDRPVEGFDAERYQTVYGREEGSVAAPTAGLHFTQAVLDHLEGRGVRIARIVLHVGVGTFRPVEVEDPAEHIMHEERYSVGGEAAETINDAKSAGGSVWAVGTTVTRTLESIAAEDGRIFASGGATALFIRPGYQFRVVDRLLTNFHLPRSTLLMLVCAFGGYEHVMATYATAVRERYRFYSYGDAMLVMGV
ncbi:MAG: tRNA preQ1(34) S-adenosylmethionine ribosyltransferase-isomerase QueA [Longimicrobiales bacterium]